MVMGQSRRRHFGFLIGLSVTIGMVGVGIQPAEAQRQPNQVEDALEEAFRQSSDEIRYRLLLPLAEQGNVVAQLVVAQLVGGCRDPGEKTSPVYDIIPADPVLSMKWYRLAAEKGDPIAQYVLADGYRKGKKCNENYILYQDDVLALKWYRLLAEQGFLDAMFKIAEILHAPRSNGGVPRDAMEAYRWAKIVAIRGSRLMESLRRTGKPEWIFSTGVSTVCHPAFNKCPPRKPESTYSLVDRWYLFENAELIQRDIRSLSSVNDLHSQADYLASRLPQAQFEEALRFSKDMEKLPMPPLP